MTAFVENAVDFHLDYLRMENTGALLPKSITSALDGRLGLFEDRMAKLLFKLTVATDMNVGVLSDAYQFSAESLRRRRTESVKNVKQANGILSLEQRAHSEDGE